MKELMDRRQGKQAAPKLFGGGRRWIGSMESISCFKWQELWVMVAHMTIVYDYELVKEKPFLGRDGK